MRKVQKAFGWIWKNRRVEHREVRGVARLRVSRCVGDTHVMCVINDVPRRYDLKFIYLDDWSTTSWSTYLQPQKILTKGGNVRAWAKRWRLGLIEIPSPDMAIEMTAAFLGLRPPKKFRGWSR